MQFIECVWQLKQQFPLSFEFNTKFLVFILDGYHDSKWGNFLYNCEKDRIKSSLHLKTESIWLHILANKTEFVDPAYRYNPETLIPNTGAHQLQFWHEYYRRRDFSSRKKENVADLVGELLAKNLELQRSIDDLKTKQFVALQTHSSVSTFKVVLLIFPEGNFAIEDGP